VTDSSTNATLRAAEALGDPDRLFDLAQVRFFMAAAEAYGYERRRREERTPSRLSYLAGFETGYRQRVTEENAAYPPEPMRLVTTHAQDAVRVHRERVGVDVVAPREGDWPGGDADTAMARYGWDADRDESEPLKVSVRTRTERGRLVWADQ
jgi:hypothetical protein